METIKISVNVSVNLSENTQNFIKSLFNAAPAAPAAPAGSSSKTIEDVRKALSQKVNDHRSAIKEKLNELGAPSVTKLDPSKYDEMFNFLEAL